MQKLTLTLTLPSSASPPQTRSFSGTEISIGRATGNDWVLGDPDRNLSRQHCVIRFVQGRHWLEDTSANGVYINDLPKPLGPNGRVLLHEGDRIFIGPYQLTVGLAWIAEPGTAAAIGLPTASGDGLSVSDLLNPTKEISGHSLAGPPPPAKGLAWPAQMTCLADDSLSGLFAPSVKPSTPARTDHNHAPSGHDFVRPPEVERPPAVSVSPAAGDWPADWQDAPFGDDASLSDDDDDAVFAQHLIPAKPVSATPAPAPPVAKPVVPVTAVAPQLPEPARAPQTAAPPATPGDGAAVQAFLSAASLSPAQLGETDPVAIMTRAGAVWRAAIEGLMTILDARTMVKTDLRMDRTMLQPLDNNPLKFSVSPDRALLALLDRPKPGYLEPAKATCEAVRDIQAHEMALVGAMQIALNSLLDRFRPDNLKQKLDSENLLGSIVPALRKARYWEIYENDYRRIAEDMENNFHGVFGQALTDAYEAQVEAMARHEGQK